MPVLGARGARAILGGIEALRKRAGESTALPRDHHLGVLASDSRAHGPRRVCPDLGAIRRSQRRPAHLEGRRTDNSLPPGDARFRARPAHLRSSRSGPVISLRNKTSVSLEFLDTCPRDLAPAALKPRRFGGSIRFRHNRDSVEGSCRKITFPSFSFSRSSAS